MNSIEHMVIYLNKLYNPLNNTDKNNLQIINDNKSIYNISSLNNFNDDIKSKLDLLQSIGTDYYDKNDEKKINVNINNILKEGKKTLLNIYNYTKGDLNTKKKLLNKYNKVDFFAKLKNFDISIDKNDPENYRFMCNHSDEIKIIDKLFVYTLRDKFPNLINKYIFKAGDKFNDSCRELADKNTKSIDETVLLDLTKAFDSIDWDIFEKLLIRALNRKKNNSNNISSDEITLLVAEYLLIIRNRIFNYRKKIINVSIGISQGLPSSTFIFTIIFQEIIDEWLEDNIFKIDIDFLLNIFVDDIYIKVKNLVLKNDIIKSLILILEKYKLKINTKKSKADPKLELTYLERLTDKDFYLGIPFTRDINSYQNIILENYKNGKHRNRDLNINCKNKSKNDNYESIILTINSWDDIYDYLVNKENVNSKTNKKILLHLYGYLQYKLIPLIKDYEEIRGKCNKQLILNFIKEKFLVF